MCCFEQIMCSHVFRELNTLVDDMSKADLLISIRHIIIDEIFDELVVDLRLVSLM